MARLWVVGEPGPDGGLARISTEVATLARELGTAGGHEVSGIVVAADPGPAAADLAAYLPLVLTIADPAAADHAWSAVAAGRLVALIEAQGAGADPDVIFVGAGPDGRDLAGAVSALTGLGVLTNATGVAWIETGPAVDMSVFGGKLLTTSGFTTGRGIVTVRPNVTAAAPAASPGQIEARTVEGDATVPPVTVVERVAEAGAAVSIEEAKVIVAGGRGVGGPEGFELVEKIAEALGGVVGASRAAVDSGWIPYSRQIGQTGKIVKPELYLALGISGAIQHKVGMRTAGTIVAVNRDPDAPIADFADLFVAGDLFEVGNALLARLSARSG
jgi:electron transfer flavoprotein alpha subunit